MLIRKLKCSVCGGNKVNEISTGYIYCDYCSSLMGYDMQKIQGEAKQVFSPQNLSKKPQQEFISYTQTMAQALKTRNAEAFIDVQLKIHKLEFTLFPKRFSPKVRQPAYQKKVIDFYRLFWREEIDNGYFHKQVETQKNLSELGKNLKISIVNNLPYTEYNEDFEKYLDGVSLFIKNSVAKTLKMSCIDKYPEPLNSSTPDALYKQGINGFIQQLDEKILAKAVKYLNLKSEYIEIDDIQLSETKCIVCETKLKVPTDSKSMVCETCGTTNNFETKDIQCPGCGAPFAPDVKMTCPYCA